MSLTSPRKFGIQRYLLYFFNEDLFVSSSSSIIFSKFIESVSVMRPFFCISPRFNRNKLLLFNKTSEIRKVL